MIAISCGCYAPRSASSTNTRISRPSANRHRGMLRADVLELRAAFAGQQRVRTHNLHRQRPQHLVAGAFELDGRIDAPGRVQEGYTLAEYGDPRPGIRRHADS